ncbi:hypothetical protein F5X68DRAFT_243127 [Plectosphaerella plurivora]|uniref:Uncharacterized protein n=1 Tax=Plectosphaerella plurivora TaxID=936078 RepID=A0A9P9A6C0_9PEZI|nr:hypothetical protein F5X68DRAFT_243127 [Plectosphaerella plurivora]
MDDGKVNPKGAKQRSAETKAQVLRVLEKFTPEVRAAVEACLEKDDHFGLFRLLEDLIVARQIDDLMRRDQEFRKYLASIYAARHPRLNFDDVGRAIEEEGAEMDWRREQENKPPKPTEEEHQAYLHREIQRLEVLKAKEDELGIELIPREKPMFIPIPLAPSEGGPAPREPFPSDWTFRIPADDKKFMYDPRKTCESFLPPLYPPGKDPRLQPPGPPGSGLDEKTMDTLLNRVKDVTRAVNVQEKMKEAAEKGETLPRWSLETLRLDRRWKEKHDPAVVEHEDPPVEVFWQMMLEDLAEKGANPETFTLDDARELQGEILAARPNASTSKPPPKRPWQERFPEYARQQDGDTIMRNTQFGTPQTENSFYSPHPPPNTANAFPSPEATPTRSKGKEKEPQKKKRKTLPPNIYDEDRLFATLENARDAHPEDTAMHEYRGWRIHSPMIQIIRIKNFLADEDLDRTMGWHAHFDEVAAYLKHLWDDVWDGTQRWGPGLAEAICMLKTHDLFETRAYGRQYPNIHFETPVFAPRLRPHNDVPGISVTTDPAPGVHKNVAAAAKTITPRYLLHRVPESIHDVDYQIPGPLLRTRFLTWFRQDTERVWYSDPMAEGTAGSGSRGRRLEDYGYNPDFNMAEVEDEAYNMCIEGGTNETAAALRGDCNFNMEPGHFVVEENGTAWPDGEAARKFAMFRGAKRAALQQCLRHFEGGQVNSALVTPFRKLVMPIPWKEKQRLRAEAQKKIFFTPIPLSETPKDVVLDPWAWNHWHDTLVGAQERRARLGFHTAYVRDRRYVVQVEKELPDDRPVLTSKNMNGPYVHSFLTERTDEYRVILKKLMGVYDLLKSKQAKTPRTLLEIIINHVGMGFDAAETGDPYSVPELDNAIVVEFERLNANSPPKNPHDPIQAARIPYRDLCWLRFILNTPSTTRRQLEHQTELKEVIRTQPVFMHRLQMLINNPDPEGFFSSLQVHDWNEIPDITAAINNLSNGGDHSESTVFSEELTSFICDLLDEYGILNRQPHPKEHHRIFYRRAFCNLHPEERINWYAVEPVDEEGHPTGLGAFPPGDNVVSWLNAATANLFDSSNLAGETGPSNADRLNFAFRLLGFRIGWWIHRTRHVVYAAYEDLETAGLGQAWSSRVEAHLREADKMITSWRHDTTNIGDRPSYGAVVKAADNSLWEEKMTRDAYDGDAVELVRANKIRELTEAVNPLWPARQDWCIDEKTGKETMTLSRGQNIWAFGREGARGRSRHPNDEPKRFFNMNRWPLHLQTPKRQALTSGGGFSRCDLDIENSTNANIVASYDNALAGVFAEKQGLQLEKEEMQRQLEMAHAQLAMRAENAVTAEQVPMSINTGLPLSPQQQLLQDWQDPKDLAPPFPEFIDPKWRFVPGRTEFWEGDTRLQRKTFDKQWREVFEGPAEKPRGFWSSIFGSKSPPSPNVQNPEVEFPKYTDPKKSRIPRSYPRAPEEDLLIHAFKKKEAEKAEAEKAAREAAEQLHEEELDEEKAWEAGEQLLREAQRRQKMAEEELHASFRETRAALAEAEALAEEDRRESEKLLKEYGFGVVHTAGVVEVPGVTEPAGVGAVPSVESPTQSEIDAERAKANLDKIGQFTGITPVTGRVKKFKDPMPPPPRP